MTSPQTAGRRPPGTAVGGTGSGPGPGPGPGGLRDRSFGDPTVDPTAHDPLESVHFDSTVHPAPRPVSRGPGPAGRRAAAWRVVGASVAGESHREVGLPCQDACAWVVRTDGVVLTAVADGAGSSILGDVGARVAVAAAIAGLRETPVPTAPGVLDAALDVAIAAVFAEAEARDCDARDLACTLILAAAGPDRAVAVQVGDGAAVAVVDGEGVVPLTRPPVGEYVNQTTFLVSRGARDEVQSAQRVGPIRALILFSDGLQRLALRMPAGEPHAGFFDPVVAFAAAADPVSGSDELAVFLASERVARRSDDDRTLVVAVRAAEAG